jgi:hypothetical protein
VIKDFVSTNEALASQPPSRLPFGSLSSAWTGPAAMPEASLSKDMAGCENGIYLTLTGLLLEGTDLNRRRQPFHGCQINHLHVVFYQNTRLTR